MLHENIFDDAEDKALALKNRVKFAANRKKRNISKSAYNKLKSAKSRLRVANSYKDEMMREFASDKKAYPRKIKELKKNLQRTIRRGYQELVGDSFYSGGNAIKPKPYKKPHVVIKNNADKSITLFVPNIFKYGQNNTNDPIMVRVAELLPYFKDEEVYENVPLVNIKETDDDEISITRVYDNNEIYRGKATNAISEIEKDIKINTSKYLSEYINLDILYKLYGAETFIEINKLNKKYSELINKMNDDIKSINESMINEELVKGGGYKHFYDKADQKSKDIIDKALSLVDSPPIVYTDDTDNNEYFIMFPIGLGQYITIKGFDSEDEFLVYKGISIHDLGTPINSLPNKKNKILTLNEIDEEKLKIYIKGLRDKEKEMGIVKPTFKEKTLKLMDKAKVLFDKSVDYGKRAFTEKSFMYRLNEIDSEMIDELAKVMVNAESEVNKTINDELNTINVNRAILKKL